MRGKESQPTTPSRLSEVRLAPEACANLVDVLHAVRASGGDDMADAYAGWFDEEIRGLAEDKPWLWEWEADELGSGLYRVHVAQHVMYVHKHGDNLLVTHIGHQSSDIDILLER